MSTSEPSKNGKDQTKVVDTKETTNQTEAENEESKNTESKEPKKNEGTSWFTGTMWAELEKVLPSKEERERWKDAVMKKVSASQEGAENWDNYGCLKKKQR